MKITILISSETNNNNNSDNIHALENALSVTILVRAIRDRLRFVSLDKSLSVHCVHDPRYYICVHIIVTTSGAVVVTWRIDPPTCLDDCLHDNNTRTQVKSLQYNTIRCSVSLNLTSAPAWCKSSTVSAGDVRMICTRGGPVEAFDVLPSSPVLRIYRTLVNYIYYTYIYVTCGIPVLRVTISA